jgi:hypothetical protein
MGLETGVRSETRANTRPAGSTIRSSMSAKHTRSIYHFYGYDPRGSRFYDRLIRGNIEAQSGPGKAYPECTIEREVTELFTKINITRTVDGVPNMTTLSLVRWEKFIARTLIRSDTALILHGYWTYLLALFTGVIARVFWINWKLAATINILLLAPTVLALIPFFIVLSVWPGLSVPYQVLAGLGCLAGTHVLLWSVLMKRMFPRFFIWGMTLYYAMGGLTKRIDFAWPEYDALLDQVADHIAREIEDQPHRQIVLVGHSAGAILANEVAGRLVDRLADRVGANPIRLINLGGAWAILSALNGERAVRHRATVAKLLSAPGIEWADIVSRRDVLSVSDTKIRMPRIIRRQNPTMINFEYVNPKYSKIFDQGTWRTHNFNFVEMHFQYLLVPFVAGRYNYLNIIFNPWGDSIRSFVFP